MSVIVELDRLFGFVFYDIFWFNYVELENYFGIEIN